MLKIEKNMKIIQIFKGLCPKRWVFMKINLIFLAVQEHLKLSNLNMLITNWYHFFQQKFESRFIIKFQPDVTWNGSYKMFNPFKMEVSMVNLTDTWYFKLSLTKVMTYTLSNILLTDL